MYLATCPQTTAGYSLSLPATVTTTAAAIDGGHAYMDASSPVPGGCVPGPCLEPVRRIASGPAMIIAALTW